MSPVPPRRAVGGPRATRLGSTHAPPVLIHDSRALPSGATVLDVFERALRELFVVRNPQMPRRGRAAEKAWRDFFASHQNAAVWVYYPWRNLAVRTLPEELYFELRTARNRNLITEQEQRAFRDTVVGIAGLSVGSSVLSALVMSGGPKTVKVADPDVVEISNLNRIRARVSDVGTNKAVVAAREAWEVDPFAQIEVWDSGITERSLRAFILNNPRLAVFVDEMDNLALKALARIVCRAHRIPVLMATDNGDGALLDVERFDREPGYPLFHGAVDAREAKGVRRSNLRDWLRVAVKIIGPRHMTERHQGSLLEVGKTLAGAPQLGIGTIIAGAAASFAIRRIANRQPLRSGRYSVNLEEALVPAYHGLVQRKRRARHTKEFLLQFARR